MSEAQLGRVGAIEGMKRAVAHADAVSPKWSDRALAYVAEFANFIGKPFIAAELRAYAYKHGLDSPTTEFAWGAVMNRAARDGIVKANGFRMYDGDKTSHMKAVREWVAAANVERIAA